MVRRFAIALSLLGGIACASSPEVSPISVSPVVPGSNERVNVSHVYVLVDSSSSIAQDFAAQKATVQSLAAAMPDGDYQVAAIAFGGYERQSQGLNPFDRENLKQGAANLRFLSEGTPLDRVITELTPETQGKFGRGQVVVFSDGLPTDPVGREIDDETVIAAARQLRSDWEGELCFHTVQTGNDPEGAAFLTKLSQATSCGSARSLSSIQTADALQAFEREIFFGRAAVVAPVVRGVAGDADGDGVMDEDDQCPGTPGGATADGRGCWVVPGLQFAFDKADIKPRYEGDLQHIVRVLKENPGIEVRLDGHTDSTGAADYNQALSERRARAVEVYLEKNGIAAGRVSSRGFGESRPAYSNDTEEGQAKNRRTEITVLQSR
jgi:OOP family OmpA-OmpF porin